MALQRSARYLVALLSLGIAIYAAVHLQDARHLRSANRAGVAGHYSEAVAEARRVRREPARHEALVVQGTALRRLGRPKSAARVLRAALRVDPDDWSTRRDLASALLATGQRRSARHQMAVALALNPRMILPPGFAADRREP